jgi:hypothetical protein
MQSAAFSSATPTAALWAAVAHCAPSHCVIAPCPEHEKAWQLGRCSRPLSPLLVLPLLCGLLSLIASHHIVSLPLARSLKKPGSLGNTASWFLLQLILEPPAIVTWQNSAIRMATTITLLKYSPHTRRLCRLPSHAAYSFQSPPSSPRYPHCRTI